MSRLACLWSVLLLTACFGQRGDDTRFVPDTDLDPVFEGVVSVDPTSLTIAGVPGERVVGTVVVANVGEYDLTLISAEMVEDGGDVLVTDAETNSGRVISRDRQFEVLVRCELPADGGDSDAAGADGVLRVSTSDPDTPVVDVDVSCMPDA